MYDLILRGGTIADGTGDPPFEGDVAVKDGRIAMSGAKGDDLGAAAETVDAQGLTLAPGRLLERPYSMAAGRGAQILYITDPTARRSAEPATDLTVLAGGTDFYPARVGEPLDDDVLDVIAEENLPEDMTKDVHHWMKSLATEVLVHGPSRRGGRQLSGRDPYHRVVNFEAPERAPIRSDRRPATIESDETSTMTGRSAAPASKALIPCTWIRLYGRKKKNAPSEA